MLYIPVGNLAQFQRGVFTRNKVHKYVYSPHRFSTTSPPSTKQSEENNVGTSSTLLYRRHPSKALFPRMLLSLSTIHTGYWAWYVLDFTPALQSAVEQSSSASKTASDLAATVSVGFIDNTTIGYMGLSLAICMSIGSIIYPQSLIQEIRLQEKKKELEIKAYSLPFILPSSTPKTYKLGDIVIDSPRDVKQIIEEYNNDISRYDGYLPLHVDGRYINWLLQLNDIHESKDSEKREVVDSKMLLYSLVPPELRNILYPMTDKKPNVTRNNANTNAKKQRQKERRLLRRK